MTPFILDSLKYSRSFFVVVVDRGQCVNTLKTSFSTNQLYNSCCLLDFLLLLWPLSPSSTIAHELKLQSHPLPDSFELKGWIQWLKFQLTHVDSSSCRLQFRITFGLSR